MVRPRLRHKLISISAFSGLLVNSHKETAGVCAWNPVGNKYRPPIITTNISHLGCKSDICAALDSDPNRNHRGVLFLDAWLSMTHGVVSGLTTKAEPTRTGDEMRNGRSRVT